MATFRGVERGDVAREVVVVTAHGSAGDESFKSLTYQLPTVGYWPTVAMTGNGELGFDSGEGA